MRWATSARAASPARPCCWSSAHSAASAAPSRPLRSPRPNRYSGPHPSASSTRSRAIPRALTGCGECSRRVTVSITSSAVDDVGRMHRHPRGQRAAAGSGFAHGAAAATGRWLHVRRSTSTASGGRRARSRRRRHPDGELPVEVTGPQSRRQPRGQRKPRSRVRGGSPDGSLKEMPAKSCCSAWCLPLCLLNRLRILVTIKHVTPVMHDQSS